MVLNRSRVLAKLADWSQLRTGTPDAVDQLRQQLQAIGIEVQDPRALRLIGRAIALAEELHSGIGDEPEYMKRARLNYALARLCSHLEAGMADEMVRESLPPARGARQADTVE